MKKYLLLLLLLGNMYDSWSLGISGNMSEKQQVNMIDNGKAWGGLCIFIQMY